MTMTSPSPLQPLSAFAQRIKTSSALAPLLTADVIAACFGVAAVGVGGKDIAFLAFAPLGLMLMATIFASAYWARVAPDRLRTEDYQLERGRLLLAGDERNPNDPRLIEGTATSNTALYLPLVYCVKSELTASDPAIKLKPFFGPSWFMVAEMNPRNSNGWLPPPAWEWFYLPHHQKLRAPVLYDPWQPTGLLNALTGSQGGSYSGGLLRLLSPPKKE